MSIEETQKSAKATCARKIEANRRNAQHSTGPKTDAGKAKSSKNSTTHGLFVTNFLNGATPETVAEVQELAAGLLEYYKPEGILEEILVQKIVVETARYSRVLAIEQQKPESGRTQAYLLHCLDKTSRYSTSTSRALYRAMEELDRLQEARKARELSQTSESMASTPVPSQDKGGQPEKQVSNNSVSNSSFPEDPEPDIGKTVVA